jgi:hypothetical protein
VTLFFIRTSNFFVDSSQRILGVSFIWAALRPTESAAHFSSRSWIMSSGIPALRRAPGISRMTAGQPFVMRSGPFPHRGVVATVMADFVKIVFKQIDRRHLALFAIFFLHGPFAYVPRAPVPRLCIAHKQEHVVRAFEFKREDQARVVVALSSCSAGRSPVASQASSMFRHALSRSFANRCGFDGGSHFLAAAGRFIDGAVGACICQPVGQLGRRFAQRLEQSWAVRPLD